jgi:hypothetical protein
MILSDVLSWSGNVSGNKAIFRKTNCKCVSCCAFLERNKKKKSIIPLLKGLENGIDNGFQF